MKRLFSLGIVLIALLGLVTISSAQVLRVGTDAAYPPFESINEKGEFEGFDMDLIRAIGDAIGMEVELMNTAWDGIIPGLINGDYDLIISAMTITPERAEAVLFSDPYFEAGQSILIRKDTDDIQGPEDLIGKRVAVQIGTTGDLVVSEIAGINVSRFNLMPEAFQELLNRAADAVVGDNAMLVSFAAQNSNVYIVGEPFTEESYGMAMRPTDKELAEKINTGLAKIKADGTYDELLAKWF
ncbi:MAG: basic amino acid ABC transporter substrate-binding protein [Limnochordia bacterium]